MRASSLTAMPTHQPERPALSVVTLTRDEPARLRATVESVDRQRDCTIEHLIVNGGTPVPLGDTLNPLVSRRVIDAPPHGIYDAMNRGLAAAQGAGIMFLHSGDCLFRADSASTALALLSEGGWGYGRLIVVRNGQPRVRHEPPYSHAAVACGLTYIPHPSTIMSTTFLRHLGGFDPSMGVAADQLTLLRAGQLRRPTRTRVLLAVHYQDGQSANRDPDLIAAEYRAIRRTLGRPVLGRRSLDDTIAEIGTAARKARRRMSALRALTLQTGVTDG